MSIDIQRSALLPYSAQAMYELVNDVRRYPEFLPWCVSTELLESTETSLRARISVAKAGISQHLTTRNRMVPGESILLEMEDGPFKHFRGQWQFKPLMEKACKISLELSFDYDSPLVQATLGPIYTQAANTMVDAFCQRAKQLYG